MPFDKTSIMAKYGIKSEQIQAAAKGRMVRSLAKLETAEDEAAVSDAITAVTSKGDELTSKGGKKASNGGKKASAAPAVQDLTTTTV